MKISDLPTVYVDKDTFKRLPEYSCSLPSATTVGKWWKIKDAREGWLVGCYAKHPSSPELVSICRRKLSWLPWLEKGQVLNLPHKWPELDPEATFV